MRCSDGKHTWISSVFDEGARYVREPCVAVMNNGCSSRVSQSRSSKVADDKFDCAVGNGDNKKNCNIHYSRQTPNTHHRIDIRGFPILDVRAVLQR